MKIKTLSANAKGIFRNAIPQPYYALRRLKSALSSFLFNSSPVWYRRKIIRDIHSVKTAAGTGGDMRLCGVPNIVIEQSNMCNLNCAMCMTKESKREKAQMPKDLFEKVVIQKAMFGQMLLTIHTVGEPLMCSYMEDLFKICIKHRIYLNITTNGLLVPKHIGLIRKYPGVVKFMAFSVDGACKETYEHIRKGGDFATLIEALELIRDYNKRTREKISINLQACISKENFREIPLFFRTFRKYFSKEEIIFTFMTNLSAAHSDSAYYRDNMPIDIKLYRQNCPCGLLWRQIHVLNDGKVSACCRDYNGELIVGDVNKSSLLDIWHSKEYGVLRQRHLEGKLDDISLCRDCYIVDKPFIYLFNDYARHLSLKNVPDEYYLEKIKAFLKIIYDLKDTGNFDKKDLGKSFVR